MSDLFLYDHQKQASSAGEAIAAGAGGGAIVGALSALLEDKPNLQRVLKSALIGSAGGAAIGGGVHALGHSGEASDPAPTSPPAPPAFQMSLPVSAASGLLPGFGPLAHGLASGGVTSGGVAQALGSGIASLGAAQLAAGKAVRDAHAAGTVVPGKAQALGFGASVLAALGAAALGNKLRAGDVGAEKMAKLRPLDERWKRLCERRGQCARCGEPNTAELNRCGCGTVEKSAVAKQEGDKWLLYTKDGKRVLGRHDTPQAAYAQERAIQKSQERKGELQKAAAKMVRKTEMVEKHHDHCPHCDHEFQEKGYPRPINLPEDEQEREKVLRSGDYDEACPACGGVIDQEEMSDEDIERHCTTGFFAQDPKFCDQLRQTYRTRRDNQKRRREDREKSAAKAPSVKEIAAAMTEAGLPRDVQFFVNGNRATAYYGDWHEKDVVDAGNKLGQKLFSNWETPDDSEIGKPEWATGNVRSDTKPADTIHDCRENTCPQCGHVTRYCNDHGADDGHEAKKKTKEKCYSCRNGMSKIAARIRGSEAISRVNVLSGRVLHVKKDHREKSASDDSDGKDTKTDSPEREKLLDAGSCCGSGCDACPYTPRHEKGSTDVSPDLLAADEGGGHWYRKNGDAPKEKKAATSNLSRFGGVTKSASKRCPGCGRPFEKGEPYPGVENCEICERYGPPKEKSAATGLRQARNVTHTDPTPAQAHAGNYRKGEFDFHGLTIKIENPKGTERRGYNAMGAVTWRRVMHADYGYFKGTKAVDGDAIDVFVGPDHDSDLVVAIDQYKDAKEKNFDETKFVVGVTTQEQGEKLYLRHYPRGWRLGPVSTTTVPQLKAWLKDGKHKKPFQGQLVKAATPAVFSALTRFLSSPTARKLAGGAGAVGGLGLAGSLMYP